MIKNICIFLTVASLLAFPVHKMQAQNNKIKELERKINLQQIKIRNAYRAEKWIPVLNQTLTEVAKMELDLLSEKYIQLKNRG